MNFTFSSNFNKNVIGEVFTPFLGNVTNFSDLNFQKKLVDQFRYNLPEIYSFSQEVKKTLLVKPNFAIIKGLQFNSLPTEVRDLFILAFNASMGYATPTDQVNKKVLWPVKAELNPTVKNLTFSQRLGEAEYHTDTQYFAEPEEFFSLWCIVPDKNGEGLNGLVSADYIISEIKTRPDGEEILNTLKNTKFPFRVPSVFTADGTDTDIEYFLGSILSENPKIRYRKETIDKGVLASGIKLSPTQVKAINAIEEILQNPKEVVTNLLEKDEVIFVNNHELLHNRTDYHDPERFLIRVRIKN